MTYKTLDEAYAAKLFHPNCGHRLLPYTPGISKPEEDTPDEIEKNKVSYAARQRQRALERNMRKWKRREASAVTPEEQRKAKAKIRESYAALEAHVKKHNLSRKRSREGIGKTRYGNNPRFFGGTDKFLIERAVISYENFTGESAPSDFLDSFLPKMAGVTDYTIIRKEVFRYLGN